MAVELKGENPSLVGFPVLLVLKEKHGFSIQVDCGESIQPAARRVLQETHVLRSGLSSMDFVTFLEEHARYVCENSAGDNQNPQELEIPQDSKILRYCIFFEKSICFGDYGLQPELFLTLKMELILTPARCNFFLLAFCEGIT